MTAKRIIYELANPFQLMVIAFIWQQLDRKLQKSDSNSLPCSKLSGEAGTGPLEHISVLLTLSWEIISQLGPLSKGDPFHCRIQKAQQT